MSANWLASVQQWPTGLLIFIGVVGLVALFVGFSALRRYRLIEDVPTAKVRSAHQGYVELRGVAAALPGEPIVAPLTQTHCCWFSYRVEHRADKGWRTLHSSTSDGLFLLRDETGECVIDPDGAEVDSAHSQTWYGDAGSGVPGMHRLEREMGLGLRVATRVLSHTSAFVGDNHRFSEQIILEGDPLYAIGEFRSLDDSDFSESERARMLELLREWKANPETLRARFDHDRNGVIDQREWEHARQVAAERAREELAEARTDTHVHLLRRPRDRLFLIANREQPVLIRRLRWRAGIGLGVFGVALMLLAVAFAGQQLGA